MPRLTVSFCIPTHGRSHLLLEALESGLAQTRLPDEIVVSDDLGSEETRALVAKFAQHASFPVRYVHCTAGASQAANMNHCLREAASDLILLLHDDDVLMPRAVEILARPFEENDALVSSYGKQLFIDDAGDELPDFSESINRIYRRDPAHAGLQRDPILAGIQQQFPNDGFMVKASVAREVSIGLNSGPVRISILAFAWASGVRFISSMNSRRSTATAPSRSDVGRPPRTTTALITACRFCCGCSKPIRSTSPKSPRY